MTCWKVGPAIRAYSHAAKRAALLPQRLSDKGARRRRAAAAEQPFGPWPSVHMAASLPVDVSAYIFLAFPCLQAKRLRRGRLAACEQTPVRCATQSALV